LLGSLFLLACEGKRELREWQPSDHQPPPEVPPEGQGEGSEQGDPNERAATALWGMRCATCHGDTGRGDGTGRPPGAVLPDMTSATFQSGRSDRELHEVIKKGRNMMPAFGDQLSELGIEALVKHIRALATAK
jgi:mono/diheme cytochrome c family protein